MEGLLSNSLPSTQPTWPPTLVETTGPTGSPLATPSKQPAEVSSTASQPTGSPTDLPSPLPTSTPTSRPSSFPLTLPTSTPSFRPTGFSSGVVELPSAGPSVPNSSPSSPPTSAPTHAPTTLSPATDPAPNSSPSSPPTSAPTLAPTALSPITDPAPSPSTSNPPSIELETITSSMRTIFAFGMSSANPGVQELESAFSDMQKGFDRFFSGDSDDANGDRSLLRHLEEIQNVVSQVGISFELTRSQMVESDVFSELYVDFTSMVIFTKPVAETVTVEDVVYAPIRNNASREQIRDSLSSKFGLFTGLRWIRIVDEMPPVVEVEETSTASVLSGNEGSTNGSNSSGLSLGILASLVGLLILFAAVIVRRLRVHRRAAKNKPVPQNATVTEGSAYWGASSKDGSVSFDDSPHDFTGNPPDPILAWALVGCDASVVSDLATTGGARSISTRDPFGHFCFVNKRTGDMSWGEPPPTVREAKDEQSSTPPDTPSRSSFQEEIIIKAPPGPLGVVLDSTDFGSLVVTHIKSTSPIAEHLQVGDKLVTVDGVSVSHLSAIEASEMICERGGNPERRLGIERTPPTIDTDLLVDDVAISQMKDAGENMEIVPFESSWLEGRDPLGRRYFLHSETGEMMWEPPHM